MKRTKIEKLLIFLFTFFIGLNVFAQLPDPAIVGYWENWYGTNFVKLKDIDSRYNVITIAFATPKTGTDYDMELVVPYTYSKAVYKSEISILQNQGKKVILSIGGQNHPVVLNSIAEKNTFVSSVNAIIDDFGFDGIDIDIEGTALEYSNITIANPSDAKLVNMIDAIKEILANHKTNHNDEKLLLLMAPEAIYVQGALSPWENTWNKYKGAYLPIIEALRDDIDMVNVQLYNSGSMYGLDKVSGGEFSQSTADFIVAMTEAVIKGFTAESGIGVYSGLPASKVGVGLPGCAGYGYTSPAVVRSAIDYLMGKGSKPGSYTLKKAGGYPDLLGMMVWSINSDKKCSPSYGYVNNWNKIFNGVVSTDHHITKELEDELFYPNPVNSSIHFTSIPSGSVSILDLKGNEVLDIGVVTADSEVDLENLTAGFYLLKLEDENGTVSYQKLLKQ